MILILSSKDDSSTSEVIDWLLHFNADFIRINEDEPIEISISMTNDLIETEAHIKRPGKESIKFSDIRTYWYRRGYLNSTLNTLPESNNQCIYINGFLIEEQQSVNFALHALLKSDKKYLGAYQDNFLNKLEVLNAAKRSGLQIPATLITKQKKDLLTFLKRHPKIITKAITNALNFSIQSDNYFLHTIALDSNSISTFPDQFPIILVQEQLMKKYELRVFFLEETFYSSVIFSQNDSKTSVDFRNYNKEKPNRVCPFKLPINIEENLLKLVKQYGFKTGSIDIVVTTDDEFVFLEINPIGQFKQVSTPCNYYLEEAIALTLSNYEPRSTNRTKGSVCK
jgi:ATP-GRASP peptide maturase of grasp-with-spasm system